MVASNHKFPPCTAVACSVDEEEKERAAAEAASKPTCEMTEKCVSACAAYGRVCPCAARIAAMAACQAAKELAEHSRIFDSDVKPNFTYLNADDIKIGERLGSGGFSNVNECVVTSGAEAGQEFAVKYLKRKAMVDLSTFRHGASDLVIEAYFLQALDHPNIVKLHGVTAGSVESNVATGKECGFFIVVDRLYDTLEQRIDQWHKEQEAHPANILTRLGSEYKQQKKEELMERIRIAYSIAKAMEYLHSRDIVFRDLKPDNIGFDKDGVLKLFDFGLSKELKDHDKKHGGKYSLTGNTGSRRYMAPEVAKDLPYDKSVDVYSFGILLWELCAAEKPFYGYSSGKHMQQVVLGGERPKMDSHHTAHWPVNLQYLMKKCWSPSAAARPSFTTVCSILADVLACKDNIDKLVDDESQDEKVEDQESSGAFSFLFRSPKGPRAQSGGLVGGSAVAEEEMPAPKAFRQSVGELGEKKDFSSLKPLPKGTRSKTWGFGRRR